MMSKFIALAVGGFLLMANISNAQAVAIKVEPQEDAPQIN